ncbi:hypothetical protein KIPB_005515 [Kipferlia bialata]|uniref:Uncharacterized protein n=1 Tax=Kipferlia bialata TaxID=797122 RepID=A0A9K3CX72_9EUKA|nr:hypothetical protein KIPB_005515 [Kipferlia bialata]|eukprot:g5515.t1
MASPGGSPRSSRLSSLSSPMSLPKSPSFRSPMRRVMGSPSRRTGSPLCSPRSRGSSPLAASAERQQLRHSSTNANVTENDVLAAERRIKGQKAELLSLESRQRVAAQRVASLMRERHGLQGELSAVKARRQREGERHRLMQARMGGASSISPRLSGMPLPPTAFLVPSRNTRQTQVSSSAKPAPSPAISLSELREVVVLKRTLGGIQKTNAALSKRLTFYQTDGATLVSSAQVQEAEHARRETEAEADLQALRDRVAAAEAEAEAEGEKEREAEADSGDTSTNPPPTNGCVPPDLGWPSPPVPCDVEVQDSHAHPHVSPPAELMQEDDYGYWGF